MILPSSKKTPATNKEALQVVTIDQKLVHKMAVASAWYKALEATTNKTFMPLYSDKHRYLVLMGGGGSGKSIFAGRKILERATSEPGHRILVCRKVARTLKESCFRQLLGQLSEHYPNTKYKVNKSNMTITFANGSEILFAGLDDVEKLKSIYRITSIWIEEASELLESDFNQLDIRLRDKSTHYKQIIISFNPISIMHWLKKRFFDRADDRALTHKSTYKDNRFLPEEAIRVLEAFKDIDEYYYSVYCLGLWGITGKTVFNAKLVMARLEQHLRPVRTGYFEFDDDGVSITNIRFVDDKENGFIKIYNDVEKGKPYVIGGDTAGDGSDSFVAQVIDNTTGFQVCCLRRTFDEDVYAKQLYCLGMYYNEALIGIETNYSTYPVRELERLRYKRQYVREVLDDYTHSLRHAFGFETNSKTRPVMIAMLIKAFRDDVRCVSDETTLQEMATFVRNDKFRAEAEEGAHDDCVMALCIAHLIRSQQSYIAEPEETPGVRWSESQWEDYKRASKNEKIHLRKIWGTPRQN